MRLPTALALMLAGSAPLAALEPLNPPAPLSPPPPAASPGEAALALLSAQRAQALGFPSTAVTLYRALIAVPGADTGRLTLALASALLDDGDVAGAGRVLDAYNGPRGAGWHLRAGLVAAHLQRTEVRPEASSRRRGWRTSGSPSADGASFLRGCSPTRPTSPCAPPAPLPPGRELRRVRP